MQSEIITLQQMADLLANYWNPKQGHVNDMHTLAIDRNMTYEQFEQCLWAYRMKNKYCPVPSTMIVFLPSNARKQNINYDQKLHGRVIPDVPFTPTNILLTYLSDTEWSAIEKKSLHYALCHCWSKANYRAYVELLAQVAEFGRNEVDIYRKWAYKEDIERQARFEKFRRGNPEQVAKSVQHSKKDQELLDRLTPKKFGKPEPKRMDFYNVGH